MTHATFRRSGIALAALASALIVVGGGLAAPAYAQSTGSVQAPGSSGFPGVSDALGSLGVPQDQLSALGSGEIVIADEARGEYSLGDFTLAVSVERVAVTSADGTVWASNTGYSFLMAGAGTVDWQENRGYFWPSTRHGESWNSQSVDRIVDDGGVLTLTGTLGSPGSEREYSASFTPRPGGGISVDVSVPGADTVQWVSEKTGGAGVHGFGEQFTDFDLSGRLIPIVPREQGVGRGAQPLTLLADLTNGGAGGTEAMTYAAWPTFVTDDMRGVRLDPAADSSYAFAVGDTRAADRVGLEVWSPNIRLELTAANSPKELIAQQQSGVERPPLAGWTQDGAIVGVQGGTDKVRRVVDDLEAAGTPVAGVWLQDWTGQRTTDFGDRLWWTWQHDKARYPGWSELVAELHERGIRTTTYVNPFLVDAAPKGDPSIRNLWKEASDAGLLVRNAEGAPYMLDQGGFSASLVDLTDPAGRVFMSDVIAEEVLAGGVDGFMADFAEGLPMDAVVHSGDAAELHNRWPQLWAQTVREGCEKAGRPDCVTWFRAGTLGMDSQSPAFWNGDQTVDWSKEDGLKSALLGTFSAGVSGWPVVHSDIGGYTSVDAIVHQFVRDEELLARWGEYAAFGPMFRSHEGNRPAANRQVYDEGERDAFARNARIFAALAPYREGVLDEAARTGVPAVRHPWIEFPGTEVARSDTQFMLGEAIMVAPVLERGRDSVDVVFPPGRWRHLVTGETFEGESRASVAAPIGQPAAFVDADDPRAEEIGQAVAAAARG